MSERPSHVIPLAGGCLAAFVLLIWLVTRDGTPRAELRAPGPTPARPAQTGSAPNVAVNPTGGNPELPELPVLRSLLQLPHEADARAREAVLIFTSAEAYQRFLARAAQLGITILGRLDALLAVRVRYDSLAGLQSDILTNAADYADVSANYFINIPQTPAKQDRPAQNLVPLGNDTLGFLGVTGDHSAWGRGVTIAVLDSGVAPDARSGRDGCSIWTSVSAPRPAADRTTGTAPRSRRWRPAMRPMPPGSRPPPTSSASA